jgi:hypothetical protein
MRKAAALFAVSLVFGRPAAAQNSPPAVIPDPVIRAFEQTVNTAKAGLPHVEALIPWLIVLLAGTILLAATSSIIQAFNKKWVKPATVVLGAVVTLIGAVKAAFFAIDYATCAQTVSDMRGVISKAQEDIRNYQQDGIPDGFRVEYLKQLQTDVDTLRNLDKLLRASGHGILPPGLLLIAHAQSPVQSAPQYYTIQQTGSVVASDKTSGFEFARYQALDAIARQRLKPSASELNAAIQYLDRFAQPANASCLPEKKLALGSLPDVKANAPPDSFNCSIEIRLNSLFALPKISPGQGARPAPELTGRTAPVPTKRFTLAAKEGKDVRFYFAWEPNRATKRLDLGQMLANDDGLWAFEFSGGGSTVQFPVRKYASGVNYRLAAADTLHLPLNSTSLQVVGYRPRPLAMSK